MITFHRIMNLVADFIWVKIGLYRGGQKIVKKIIIFDTLSVKTFSLCSIP